MTELARLLTAARQAHKQKTQHSGRVDKQGVLTVAPDYLQASEHARRALSLREQAHDLDPGHEDPAWALDQSANRGVTHEALCAYFRRYLEPDPERQPQSIAEIEQAVKAKDPRSSHAYALLLLESGWITHQDLPKELQDSGPFARFGEVTK